MNNPFTDFPKTYELIKNESIHSPLRCYLTDALEYFIKRIDWQTRKEIFSHPSASLPAVDSYLAEHFDDLLRNCPRELTIDFDEYTFPTYIRFGWEASPDKRPLFNSAIQVNLSTGQMAGFFFNEIYYPVKPDTPFAIYQSLAEQISHRRPNTFDTIYNECREVHDYIKVPFIYPVFDHQNHCQEQQPLEYALFKKIKMLYSILNAGYARDVFNYSASGQNRDFPHFRIRTGDPHEDLEPIWNIVWRDVNIVWYKHSNRCLSFNRTMSDAEREECLQEIHQDIAEFAATAKNNSFRV